MSFYTSVDRKGQQILVRYIDEAGNHKRAQIDFAPDLYIYSNTGKDARTIDDYPLEKLSFPTMKEAADFIDRYREIEGMKVYGQKDFVHQFIARGFRDMTYNADHIRFAFIDIEVYSGTVDAHGNAEEGPFPEPEQAAYPVNLITVYDSKTDVFYTYGMEYFNDYHVGTYSHDKTDEDVGDCKVQYLGFKTERELLTKFLSDWIAFDFDIYSGWNSEQFDTLYLFNRLKVLFGEKTAKKMSPWEAVSHRTVRTRYGDSDIVELLGLPCVDFKDLVEKHGFMEPDDWKLGTVANAIVGSKKIDYSEAKSLNTLYITNYPKTVRYNIHDVNLVKMMNDKKKFIQLTFTLAYLLKCNYKETLATVRPWSANVYFRLSGQGIQPEICGVTDGKAIIGGFVQEPIPGLYRWPASVDAASLYPHMMMQFNMGPETILPEDQANRIRAHLIQEINIKIADPNYAHVSEWLKKVKIAVQNVGLMHEFYWDTDEFVEFDTLKKHNVCMAPNCALFRLDKPGLWSVICKDVYDGRKKVKKEMLQKEQILETMKADGKKGTPEYKALESEISSLDSLQMAYKIAMNSLYGATTNKYFTGMFDPRVGEAITSAGQVGIQYVGRSLDKYFNAVTGTVGYNYAHYNDTDSAIMNLGPLVDKVFGDAQSDKAKVVDFIDQLFETKVNPLMLEWCKKLSDSYNCPENKLIFKREKIGDAGIWVAKKRYVISVWDNEGVRFATPKIKVTGLESVRSSYPKQCREWMEEMYAVALKGEESALHEKMKEVEALYKAQPPEALAKTIAVNDIEKYLIGHNTYGKGTTKQVKASIHHNQMVEKLGLSVDIIRSGDKIKMLDLVKGNPLGYETIGFVGHLPPEFGVEKYIDKQKTFEGNLLDPMTNFCGALGWTAKPVSKVSGFFF